MIVVIMMLMVISVLGVSIHQVARHTNDATAIDRERLQSVQTAEAGVADAMRRIQAGAGCDVAVGSASSLNDPTGVVGSYRTKIDPEAGTTCGQTPRRVIHSWGYAPTGGTRALRRLEVSVELVPQAGFGYTLFAEGSDGTIYIKNDATITGEAYAEHLDQTKNNLFSDGITTTGSIITKNNAVYAGKLWAAGDITLGQNSAVGGSLIASGSNGAGDIVVGSNSTVGGDVLAHGTVTQQSGSLVSGTVSQNNLTLPPPPNLTKPTFTYNPTNYSPAPITGTAATITTALATNASNLSGTYRSNDTGTIVLPDNVTVTGPLTIVTDGKVDLGKTMSISGGPHEVVIVALSTSADAIDFAKNNFTAATGINLLLYTLGGVDGRNAATFTGSVYANTIDQKNTFTISKSDMLFNNPPPGFTWDFSSASTFAVVPTLWREVVPEAPED